MASREAVRSLDVVASPEWRAFCHRFGIPDTPTRRIVITLDIADVMLVEHEYAASVSPDTPTAVTPQQPPYR